MKIKQAGLLDAWIDILAKNVRKYRMVKRLN